MQSLDIQTKILILNTEKKEKVNIYTFVNLDTNETQTIIGVKKDVPLHRPLDATISIRVSKEVLNLSDGSKKYLNVAAMFVKSIEEVKK